MIRLNRCLCVTSNAIKLRETTRCLSTTQRLLEDNAQPKENMSYVMNMFRGHIQPSQVFPFPDILSRDQKETLTELVGPVEKFFEEINDPVKNDDTATVDEKTMTALWDLGAFGIQVPNEYGGLGLANTQYARLGEIIGMNDLGLSVVLGAHQSIGFKGILLYGSPEIKEKYLPRVTSGELAAFCLTEPSSGSDAGSIRSRAVKSEDGKHYILNGSKIWISNGGLANIMTVFAQTPVVDPKTGQTRDKVTAFVVDRAFGGVSHGSPEKKMGIKCSNTAEVYYEDVKIPVENVLGKEGEGFKVAMNILNNGRFGMGSVLSGTMKTCIKKATDHATTRVQFGNLIETYGSVQEKLARMSMLQYVAESMAYNISSNMDTGSQDYHLEAAISKVFASEAAFTVCDEAIQILAGMGYMKETGLERILRDIRIFRIFEGANDILRLFVALTGIQYAGAHLKELQRAFKNPTANLGMIFGEVSKRAFRTVGLGSSPNMAHLVHPSLGGASQQAAKSVALFGQAVESALIKYGKDIVHEQFILNRIAAAATDNYAMAVVLSRASRALKENHASAKHEELMALAWCAEASDRVESNLKQIESGKYLDMYTKMTSISQNLCKNGGVVQKNPVDL